MKTHILRAVTLLILVFAAVSPAIANPPDCETYCRGFCEGWCGALGKNCQYQGYEGTYPDCDCYFGCG
jgi:hypothetical protein